MSKTAKDRELKAFLESLRDGPLTDDAKAGWAATYMSQQLLKRTLPLHIVQAIDQFRMLLALRRAELVLGRPITLPVTLESINNHKTLAQQQLLEDLRTREIQDEEEFKLTALLLKNLNRQILERGGAAEQELQDAKELILQRRQAFRRG